MKSEMETWALTRTFILLVLNHLNTRVETTNVEWCVLLRSRRLLYFNCILKTALQIEIIKMWGVENYARCWHEKIVQEFIGCFTAVIGDFFPTAITNWPSTTCMISDGIFMGKLLAFTEFEMLFYGSHYVSFCFHHSESSIVMLSLSSGA